MVKLEAAVKFPLQLCCDFLQRGVSRFTFGWSDTCVCVGGCVLPRCRRCATLIWNAWQCFTALVCLDYFSFFLISPRLIFEEWYLHPDTILLTLSRCLSILLVPFITISIVALVQLDPKVGKCHMWFCVFVWHLVDSAEDYLHMWMNRSLCVTHCVYVCACVFFPFFPCGLAPPASFCISLFSIVLPPSLPSSSSVWCLLDLVGCQPFLIGLWLLLMSADLLVWLARWWCDALLTGWE